MLEAPLDTGTPEICAVDTGEEADLCVEVDAFAPQYADVIATWTAQDDLAPGPPSPLLLVGSSSARRWEDFSRSFSAWTPLQRGFGGAQLGEVALYADALVNRHDPRGVLLYAGTNDLAVGVPADIVVDRFRCFRQRVGRALGWDRPILFLTILPTPARWSQWEEARAVNEAIAELAAEDPGVVVVDATEAFLATGSPPAAELFVSDGLHLSEAGYALWQEVIGPEVVARFPPDPAPTPTALAAGTTLRVDLGPSNADDGERSACPDWLGNCWNNWHDLEGDGTVLPGEHLDALVDITGASTAVGLVIAGGFQVNGRANGGLLWPDPALLGDLAVGSATGDFFFTTGDDVTGALYLRGLDPEATYTLRLFAAREDAELRSTAYTVFGLGSATATLQTSGDGAGSAEVATNDDTVVTMSGLAPDPWGHLYIDVNIAEGGYGYLSLLELAVE